MDTSLIAIIEQEYMGVRICKRCSSKGENDEIIFSNRYKKRSSESTFHENSKLYNLNTNNTLTESEYYKIKNKIESLIKEKGEIIKNLKISEILSQRNPFANEIKFPEEIINNNIKTQTGSDLISIQEPMVKFKNEEIYEGSWNTKAQRHGFGISINKENNIYKGLWEKDNFGSYGAFIDNNGNYYMGQLENGKAKGIGEMLIKNKMRFKGEFNDDLPCGKGVLENFCDDSIYEGDILNGMKNGYGEIKFKNGIEYKGEFMDDKFNGKGKIIFANGREYEGEFKNNKIEGNGVFNWEDGKKYEGKYVDNIKQGFGKLSWNENKYYEGEWYNNKPHGNGIYYLNGKILKGKFRFGKIISKTIE